MAGLSNLNSVFSEQVDKQTTSGVNFIEDVHATGFTINTDTTEFLGIEGSTYGNPGTLGFDNDVVNFIEDLHGAGFVPGLQPGDDTLFVGQAGSEYNNPGPSLGTFYVNDYENGPTPNFINFTKNIGPGDTSEYSGVDGEEFTNPSVDGQIQLESNQWLDTFNHKFTPNRQHLDISEFLGIDGNNYSNPGLNVNLYYFDTYNDAGTGVDVIDNIHATGFTKLRQHKDPTEFGMVDNDSINVGQDNTLFRQFGNSVFPFGGEQKNKYLPTPGNTFITKDRIDEDDVTLIQQGGTRSISIVGKDSTAVNLEDFYNSHIDDLIDFEQVKSKVDGRLDMRYDNGRANVNSFLPLQFSRNGITHEPYVVRGIGDTKNIVTQHLDDLERVGKYFLSPDGIKFIAAQNAVGLLAYFHNRSITHGTDEQYGFFGSSAGKQQFQYTYNPLSAFSTTVPFIKVRFNRSLLFDEQKYTDRELPKLFGLTLPDLTPNKNAKVAGIKKQSVEEDEHQTTLGGSIIKNVNHSIDGTTVNTQGITGDHYTIAPIDVEDEVKKLKRGNKERLDSIEDGYPFYFKDMRNDKILLFRGYVKDMSENIAPTYNTEQYIGRSEVVSSYVSTSRTLSFSLDLYANNQNEFTKIYQKLDYLTSMCYPEYFNDSSTEGYTLTRPKPPLVRMRLADLYGGTTKAQTDNANLKHGVLGYINSLSYTFNEEGTWNNNIEGERAPKFITATIEYVIIHDETPNINTRFYGVDYEKVGV